MKGLLLGLLLVYFVGPSLCYRNTVNTFEFGMDVGRISFNMSGKIGPTEKNIRVPVVVPRCSELTYVRVDVDNRIGPPHVTFERLKNTVYIKYRRLQYSRSTYVVTAKAIPGDYC